MSEQTGATDIRAEDDDIEDVCHAAFRAALERCPTIEYRIVPADAVVIDRATADTAAEACEHEAQSLEGHDGSADDAWVYRAKIEANRAAAAALRGESKT